MNPKPPDELIWIRLARLDDADAVADIAAREIGPNAADSTIIRHVMSHNAEAMFVILRASSESRAANIVGFAAHLVLNNIGVEALLDGRLNERDPDLAMLCREHDTPYALFGWAIVAKRIHRIVSPMLAEYMSVPRYQNLDFYSRPTTEAGRRALLKIGCVPARPGAPPEIGCLMVRRNRIWQWSVA